MNKERPAYSLIFAFIMMTLIMVISSTSIQDTRNKLALFRDLEANSQARLAAESAAELGIVDLKASKFTAERASSDVFCLQEDSTSDCYSDSTYTIYPYAKTNSSDSSDTNFYLPIPGTGDAAPNGDCSLSDPQDKDHSCNWNKLSSGDIITIPLYGDDGYGTPVFASSLGFNDWQLRLRTPCENGSIEDDCGDSTDRYEFAGDLSAGFESDPLIVFWQIDVEYTDGSTDTLFPNQDLFDYGTIYYRFGDNNEISEYSINNASNYEVLEASASNEPYTYTTAASLADIYLTLQIIGELVDDSSSSIPHLEWQLVWDATDPVISPRSEVIGSGYYDSGEQTYFFPYTVSYSSIESVSSLYTLSN